MDEKREYASRLEDSEMLYKDWKTGAGWQCGGAQGLLHFGVFEKAHYQPDRAGFEQWLLYQTHKIRTGSSLWGTGSDFVFSLGMITSETA